MRALNKPAPTFTRRLSNLNTRVDAELKARVLAAIAKRRRRSGERYTLVGIVENALQLFLEACAEEDAKTAERKAAP